MGAAMERANRFAATVATKSDAASATRNAGISESASVNTPP